MNDDNIRERESEEHQYENSSNDVHKAECTYYEITF